MTIKKGFTLIELLVVISIISLLSSIVFSNFTNQRAKARDARRVTELIQIRKALDLYYDANLGKYPAFPSSTCGVWNRSDAGVPGSGVPATCWSEFSSFLSAWLSNFPVDPVNSVVGTTPHVYAYQQRNGGDGYRLVAALETSSNLGDGCAILLDAPGPAGPGAAVYPDSFYCIGEKWQ
ncbi:MAG: General secretion pathway protein G [Parcubacteria group bacterium GW2011_GWA2_47_16]|nr:MAG: General secretion pathway protein G [Parcubacteria group bacterium GW2011_GWA2_47_16]